MNPFINLKSVKRDEIPEPDEVDYLTTVESPHTEEILTVKGKIRDIEGKEILIY